MSYKILRNIEIDPLDPRSISQAIREVRHVKESLQKAMAALVEQLAMTDGVQIARTQIASMDAVDTGLLEHSVFGEYSQGIGYVCALADNGEGQNYAVYVEFGTGFEGNNSQHPLADQTGWAYAVGETIGPHPKHPEWGYGWWYPGDDGRAHWTRGQPARPFMYNTLEMLREMASERAKDLLFQQ